MVRYEVVLPPSSKDKTKHPKKEGSLGFGMCYREVLTYAPTQYQEIRFEFFCDLI